MAFPTPVQLRPDAGMTWLTRMVGCPVPPSTEPTVGRGQRRRDRGQARGGMVEDAVVVAGGGPTGLLLAGEWVLAEEQRCRCRAARQPEPHRLARAVGLPAPSRCSISAASRIASSLGDRWPGSRASHPSRWVSAILPGGATTSSRRDGFGIHSMGRLGTGRPLRHS